MAGSQLTGPVRTRFRAVVAFLVGLVGAVAVGLVFGWPYAPAAGWSLAALVYVWHTWLVIGRMSPEQTGAHATREDPGRRATNLIAVMASLASLGGVLYLLEAGASKGVGADLSAALGIADVAASWLLLHTVYTLRYAELYYTGTPGGIDFNQDEEPAYADFAYLAFTLGMTYQVSDTDLKTRPIRVTALRHGLLSYLFGAIILATTINLVAGLGGSSGG
ncbi:DUF1345 domain-containing protein [Dactylosporangium sp. McL0621]|uniref:DUF1345 domain-containing protein n=1 Tax=Dactylosporangium sp. McL0621 TaxID=3415678 RepID=UPI003CFAF3EC